MIYKKLLMTADRRWSEHFALNEEGVLRGLTPEGRATVQLLEMNEPERRVRVAATPNGCAWRCCFDRGWRGRWW